MYLFRQCKLFCEHTTAVINSVLWVLLRVYNKHPFGAIKMWSWLVLLFELHESICDYKFNIIKTWNICNECMLATKLFIGKLQIVKHNQLMELLYNKCGILHDAYMSKTWAILLRSSSEDGNEHQLHESQYILHDGRGTKKECIVV